MDTSVYKDKRYERNKLCDKEDGKWPEWNNLAGGAVQQFIKSSLEDVVANVEYRTKDQKLICKNLLGNVIGEEIISVTPPTYDSRVTFNAVKVGTTIYNNGPTNVIEVSKSDEDTVTAIINYSLFSITLGQSFEDYTPQQVRFSWRYPNGDIDPNYPTVQKTITPNQDVEVAITELFKLPVNENRFLAVDYTYPNQKDDNPEVIFSNPFIVRNILLDFKGNTFTTSTTISKIKVEGLNSNEIINSNFIVRLDGNRLNTDYYSVVESNDGINLTIDYPGYKEGAHDLFIRVKSTNGKVYSNWKQINYIYQKDTDSTLTEGIVQIVNVPDTLNNCNLSNFFSIQTTDKLSSTSTIKIAVLKASTASSLSSISTIERAITSSYLFKYIELDLNSEDPQTCSNYTSYIEIPGIGTITQAMKILILDYQGTRVQKFYSGLTGTSANYEDFKIISINSQNISTDYQYTTGAILNFSQISNGNVFTNLNPEMDESDGLQLEKVSEKDKNTITTFKVSPINKLFNSPKTLLSSSNENLLNGAFSFELMFKTTNINDLNDEILRFGNITLCPKHLFIKVDSEHDAELVNPYEPTLIKNASRADFRKEVIQHIIVTYDPNYKPSTYEKMYNNLYPNYTEKAVSYPCLKIYVNGSINRVISINKEIVGVSNNTLQIAPSNSNLNIYILRTYDIALDYEQIQKNYISSLFYLTDKQTEYSENDIVYKKSDFTLVQQESKKDIIGTISLGKCLNKFKSVNNPNKVYSDRNVMLLVLEAGQKPPYYGNRRTAGPKKDGTQKGMLLISYNKNIDPARTYSGALYSEKIKAQGSSAKKYTIHNVAESKVKFRKESDKETAFNDLQDYILLPNPDSESSDIKVKKFVGKVNTASCMQSHKQGACKLMHDGYMADASNNRDWLNGGRKAVLENEFLYFWTNAKEGQDLKTISWDSFKDENGNYNFENCYFLGFLTWGSAKGDEPTSGYNSKTTPQYLMLEGADNANPAANFKVPWAAMQIWGKYNNGSYETVTSTNNLTFTQFSGKDKNGNPDYLTGLLVKDETILYNPGTGLETTSDKRADAWDVDFGSEEGEGYDSKNNPYYVFTEEAKVSLKKFAEFYNMVYLFDYSSLYFVPEIYDGTNNFIIDPTSPIINGKDMSDMKLVFGGGFLGNTDTKPNIGSIYRWEKGWLGVTGASENGKWVPAGLYYDNNKWEDLNIVTICNNYYQGFNNIHENPVFNFFSKPEYKNYIAMAGDYPVYATNPPSLNSESSFKNLQAIMAEAFKLVMYEYTDVEDIAYHQAFIKLVLGTDNRAKNTYFQIIGKIFDPIYKLISSPQEGKTYYKLENDKYVEIGKTEEYSGDKYELKYEESDKGDYKIRLYGDDLDTIFATDNNGQQVKPYYLLEPEYNTDLTDLWGDRHSGFFYNFDICFAEKIRNKLGNLLSYSVGGSWPDSNETKINKYFFNVLKSFPAISYNHQSEIYYESTLTFYNKVGNENKAGAFYSHLTSVNNEDWQDFNFNKVNQPVSLSHGRCLESEIEFMRDRVLMLSTYTGKGKFSTDVYMSIAGGSLTSADTLVKINAEKTSFIQYNYPIINGISINKNESNLNYDSIIDYIEYEDNKKHLMYLVNGLAVPNVYQDISTSFSVNGLTAESNWSNTDLYKTITIKNGSNVFNGFLNFPNASTLISQSSDYVITTKGSNIEVKDYLGSIEQLVLQNASISTPRLDFSGCNRLKTLILGNIPKKFNISDHTEIPSIYIDDQIVTNDKLGIFGAGSSTGFEEIILPKSNTLTTVILPGCVKSINIGYYKNIETFTFDEGTILTNLTIDGRNDSSIIEDIITKYVVGGTTKKVEISNVPTDGVKLSKNACRILASVSNVKIVGTVRIVDSNGALDIIDFETKKKLVEKFGDIEGSGITKFEFTTKNVIDISVNSVGSIEENGYAPVILNIDGNNIGYGSVTINGQTKYYMNIVYNIVNNDIGKTEVSPTIIRIDKNTGYITIQDNLSGIYIIQTTVKYNNNTETTFETRLTVGQYIPNPGDFMYSNSTFSPIFSQELNPIGIVYYSEPIRETNKQDVRILSLKKSSSDQPMGPGMYTSSGYYSDTEYSRQISYKSFLSKLLGDRNEISYYTDHSDRSTGKLSGRITYNSPFTSDFSTRKIKSTKTNPENTLSNVNEAKNQQEKYIGLANNYVNQLSRIGAIQGDRIAGIQSGTTPSLIGKVTFERLLNEIDNISSISINDDQSFTTSQCGTFAKALMPAHLAALYFTPNNISGKYSNSIGLGNWYIPDQHELAYLILNRILSSVNNDTNTEDNWNHQNPNDSELGIFKRDAFSYVEFLKDGRSQVCSEHSSTSSNGYVFAYGIGYYDGSPTWISGYDGYAANSQGGKDVHHNIYPCCRIEINKK